MTTLEIVLIIAGFACVCISFFMAGKREKEGRDDNRAEDVMASSLWTEKEEQIICSRISELLEERQMELVDSTEDQMNRLCNDKIMAIDEFSKQLLEKIETNHQEVVFMYNLLNEKEKEVKKIVTEPVTQPAAKPIVLEKTTQASATGLEKVAQKQITRDTERQVQKKKNEAVSREESAPHKSSGQSQPEIKVRGDVNLQIQKMYKEGKSVLEISKALDMGQGEVKLVIALYGGKAR